MSANETSKKFYLGEFNKAQYNQFLSTELCQAIVNVIIDFTNLERTTTEEEALVKSVITDINVAQRIAYSIVCANKTMPLETLIGIIGTSITKKSKDKTLVLNTMQVASEFCLYSSNLMTLTKEQLFRIRQTVNGKLIVTNLYKQNNYGEKTYYPLPTQIPTNVHKTLGDYEWKSTFTDAVEKLNHTAFCVLDFEEPEPAKYNSASDEKSGIINELWDKWQLRRQLIPQLKGSRMFFNWHQDYRGRMYAGGYHLNPQGNEYEKNILAFADMQEITYKGKIQVKHAIARAMGEWIDYGRLFELKADKKAIENLSIFTDLEKAEMYDAIDEEIAEIHANKIKLDKLTNPEKLKWYDNNKDLLLNPEVAKHADEPTAFKAQMHSMHLIENFGMTNIPVEVDATNSQLQIVAVLAGCLKTALSCNVISDNISIADAYGILAGFMSKLTGMKFVRGQIKQAMMIDGYGAGKKLVTETLKETLKEFYSDDVVDAFYKAQSLMSPTVQGLKETFQSIWDEKRDRYTWTMPNGFVVDYRPTDSYKIKVRPFGAMEIELTATLTMATKRSTGLGVNVIHSCDAYVCSEVVMNHPNNQIWTIHDGFRCHPNDVEHVITNYNTALAKLTDSTLLEDIISEIIGKPVNKINKEFTGQQVMESKYAVC